MGQKFIPHFFEGCRKQGKVKADYETRQAQRGVDRFKNPIPYTFIILVYIKWEVLGKHAKQEI